MKKLIYTGALFLALCATFTSCREEDKKDAENAIEQTGDAIEEAAQDTEEAAEGGFEAVGEAIDNAVNETEEAGEAVEDAVNEATDDDNN